MYKLDPNGIETVLHNFTGISDDRAPSGQLLAGLNGILYGLTGGEVFAIVP